MRKLILSLCLTLSFSSLYAQNSTHYNIIKSEVDAGTAQDVLNLLESNFSLYSAWLANKPMQNQALNINFYKNNSSFNDALAPQKLPGQRTDFIYLFYNNPEKNVLYLYPMTVKDVNNMANAESRLSKKAMEQALNRHGFLQYLFAVAPTSPAWFREGSALSFEAVVHPDDGTTPVMAPNRDYLKNLKEWNSRSPLSITDLVALDDQSFVENAERNLVFSWGLIHYLTATNQTNLLGQIAAAIDPSADQAANTAAVKSIVDANNLQAGFDSYIANTKTFTELVDLGRQAYLAKDNDQAKNYFAEATEARGDLYTPYYYLGLISYSTGEYDLARENYNKALNNGAPEALINYNLGFVAFKEKDYQTATDLLTKAKTADYAKYGNGADKLLRVIPTEEAIQALQPAPDSANAQATVNSENNTDNESASSERSLPTESPFVNAVAPSAEE